MANDLVRFSATVPEELLAQFDEYAERRLEYQDGRVIKETYYGISGLPVTLKDGTAWLEYVYDEEGKATKIKHSITGAVIE